MTSKYLLNMNNIGLNVTFDNKLNYHMGEKKHKVFSSFILIIFWGNSGYEHEFLGF